MSSQAFTFADVARYPRPGCTFPDGVQFSPNGQLLTFLWNEDNGLQRSVYCIDVNTGKRELLIGADTRDESSYTMEEKMVRERLRLHHTGITMYAWAAKDNRLLVNSGGELYVQEGRNTSTLRPVFEKSQLGGRSAILDPKFSTDGKKVFFVYDAEVYVCECDEGALHQPQQLTFGARGTGTTHGLADYLAQEEMSRFDGYWPSENAQYVAFQHVDDRHIPEYRIMHLSGSPTPDAHEDHRYPFAGKDNPKVKLGVVSCGAQGMGMADRTVWMDIAGAIGGIEDTYLARVSWLNASQLITQIQTRDQATLFIVSFDVHTGKGQVLHTERSSTWINLHHMFCPLARQQNGGFLWGSEKSGYMHVYRFDGSGNQIAQVTWGEWIVDNIVAIDEEANLLYFQGTFDSPLERHLYSVSLTGHVGEGSPSTPCTPHRITQKAGMHTVSINGAMTMFVDQYSSLEHPFKVELCSLRDGSVIHAIHSCTDPRVTSLPFVAPKIFSFPSADNAVTLYGSMCLPDERVHGPGPYPVMVFVYGGPHVQTVSNSWGTTVEMRQQFLRSKGYVILRVDNRGSNRRGHVFEAPIFRNMGDIEVQDQVAGVKYLIEKGIGDGSRVGICGWSYGGYMSAMCLAARPDVFHLAVAGAPVSHWENYDTHYTERYMGTPQNNVHGYATSAVMTHVPKMQGDLLLIHGLIDENVHFAHTARLINALVKEKKNYQLLMFPDARHSPRSQEDREYMEQRIFQFISERFGQK